MTEAEMTLKLIEQDCYNLSRPDTYVIQDLLQVVRNLNQRLEKLEKRRSDTEGK